MGRHLTRWLTPLPAILFAVFPQQAQAIEVPPNPYYNAPQNLIVESAANNGITVKWDVPPVSNYDQIDIYVIEFYKLTNGVESGGWAVWTESENHAYTFGSWIYNYTGNDLRFKVKAGSDACVGRPDPVGYCLYGTKASVDANATNLATTTTITTTTTTSTLPETTTTTTSTTTSTSSTTTSTTTSSTTTLPQESSTTTEPTQTSTTTSTVDTTTTTTTTTSTTVPPTTTTVLPAPPTQTTSTTDQPVAVPTSSVSVFLPVVVPETDVETTTTETTTETTTTTTSQPTTTTTQTTAKTYDTTLSDGDRIEIKTPITQPTMPTTTQTEPTVTTTTYPDSTLLDNDAPVEPINDQQFDAIINRLDDDAPGEVVADIVTQLLQYDLSSDQVTTLVTDASVLAVVDEQQAEQLFEQITIEDLGVVMLDALIDAVQDAPTLVRNAFESKIDIFGGYAEQYVPVGSSVTVSVRRTIVAVSASMAIIATPVPTRRRQ